MTVIKEFGLVTFCVSAHTASTVSSGFAYMANLSYSGPSFNVPKADSPG